MSNRLKIKSEKQTVTKTEKQGRQVVLYIIIALIVLALIFMAYTMVIMG